MMRRLTSNYPETWYCLEIQETLTEEGGAMQPPSHAWQALHDSKAGLTEVIVMGPVWAVLFYGWQSLGEGLSLGEAWDIVLTLTGALTCIGQQTRLNANTLRLWEGQWLISQAITEWCAKVRGPRHPCSHLPVPLPFRFCIYDGPHGKRGSRVLTSTWRSPGTLVRCHTMTETRHHNVAGTVARGSKTCGQHQHWHLHLCQSKGFRVTEFQSQLPHWCHHGLTDLGTPGIHTVANAAGSLEAIWRLICQSLRMRTRRMLSLIKVGIGI